MGLPALKEDRLYTFEEYLEIEDSLGGRYEYHEGRICLMSGTHRHSRTIMNTSRELDLNLSEKCHVSPGQLKVWINEHKTVYPDVLVYCGEPVFYKTRDDKIREDMILNPTVVFEVTSPSTELYDRREKESFYLALESLKEYVIIKQDTIRVDHFIRTDDEEWKVVLHRNTGDRLELKSIECELTLAQIYRRVFS
ncbi:MAG: Uma2 family endonuclease [bacterium]